MKEHAQPSTCQALTPPFTPRTCPLLLLLPLLWTEAALKPAEPSLSSSCKASAPDGSFQLASRGLARPPVTCSSSGSGRNIIKEGCGWGTFRRKAGGRAGGRRQAAAGTSGFAMPEFYAKQRFGRLRRGKVHGEWKHSELAIGRTLAQCSYSCACNAGTCRGAHLSQGA